ncbi:MAG: hypothetical protein JO069_22210, partial [Verrucomicrobia bacterium]|nr:hypothetical protein [Verrucomicrobiota bacterium]
LDNLADGTSEVGSHLDLQDAQELSLVFPFLLGHGNPYFVAYKADGTTTLYRFYSDCTGWDTVGATTTKAKATHAVAVNLEPDRALLIFY